MTDLFDIAAKSGPRPLADRLRPAVLDEVIGQDHLLGPDGPLGTMIAREDMGDAFWGPPETEVNFAHGHTCRTIGVCGTYSLLCCIVHFVVV